MAAAAEPTTHTIELTRDASTGRLNVDIEKSAGGAARINKLQGASLTSGLEAHDRITHVNGKGPLDFEAVIEALKRDPSSARMSFRIVRGEPVEPVGHGNNVAAIMALCVALLSIIVGIVLMQMQSSPAASLSPVEKEALRTSFGGIDRNGDDKISLDELRHVISESSDHDASAERSLHAFDSDGDGGISFDEFCAIATGEKHQLTLQQSASTELSSAINDALRRGDPVFRNAIKVGAETFVMNGDGSVQDPDGLRNAFLSDGARLDTMRLSNPDFARIVEGSADGGYDQADFQRMLRGMNQQKMVSKGLALNADGSAADPEAFIAAKLAEKDLKWLTGVQQGTPEVYEKILAGDDEALQTYLRAVKYHSSPGG